MILIFIFIPFNEAATSSLERAVSSFLRASTPSLSGVISLFVGISGSTSSPIAIFKSLLVRESILNKTSSSSSLCKSSSLNSPTALSI